jgi:hypothetical protein
MRANIATAVRARPAERGSAYLFVLLAILVLTAIGLSLIAVTQTEAQIGGAEKGATRVLYAAEAGHRMQVAMGMTGTDDKRNFELGTSTIGSASVTEKVGVSAMFPIAHMACPLCTQNMGGEGFEAVDYDIGSISERYVAGSSVALASSRISQLILIYPHEPIVVSPGTRSEEPENTGGIEQPDIQSVAH